MLSKIKDKLKRPPTLRGKKLFVVSVSIILIVAIAGTGFFLWNRTNDKTYPNIDGRDSDDPLVKAVKFEEKYKDEDKQSLDSGDYESYQFAKFNYAENYILAKEYKKAADILDEVRKNVPEDKLATEIYIYLADLAKQQGSNNDYKKYTEILISKLTAESRPSEAEYYKKQLNESGL